MSTSRKMSDEGALEALNRLMGGERLSMIAAGLEVSPQTAAFGMVKKLEAAIGELKKAGKRVVMTTVEDEE